MLAMGTVAVSRRADKHLVDDEISASSHVGRKERCDLSATPVRRFAPSTPDDHRRSRSAV
jgi:hypothetical protein